MKIQLIYGDESYSTELDYLCKLFSSIMQVTVCPCHVSLCKFYEPLSIGYCGRDLSSQLPDSCRIHIHPDERFWQDYLQKRCPDVHKREHSGLITLNADESEAYLIHDKDRIITNLDLFSSAFFMITGMEEVLGHNSRDEHGRFTFSRSRWGKVYVDTPLVNVHAKVMIQWIKEIYGANLTSNRSFTAIISHDIDAPYYYGTFRAEVSELINRGKSGSKYEDMKAIGNYLAVLLGKQPDPYDTFPYIQEQEGKRGIPSTYFVMFSRDNMWGLDREKYSRTLKNIQEAGNEIAVHPGYDSYHNPDLIRKELNNIETMSGARICGVRNHFLRFLMPATFNVLSKLGLSYDATVGYPDREGFRVGICTPYKPFDILRREIVDIMEIPQVVMDGTLREYRNFSQEDAYAHVEKLIEKVFSMNGVIVFNWHNSFLIQNSNDWRTVYERSLDCLMEHHARFCTCEDIASITRQYWN